VREQAAFLDDVTHTPAQADGILPGHRAAFERDLARSRFDQAVRRSKQRRLAGTAASEQHQRFALFHRQVDAAQDLASARLVRDVSPGNDHPSMYCAFDPCVG
jgi:hypothetical protein